MTRYIFTHSNKFCPAYDSINYLLYIKYFSINDNNWFWIPIVAPLLGAVIGLFLYQICVAMHHPFSTEETGRIDGMLWVQEGGGLIKIACWRQFETHRSGFKAFKQDIRIWKLDGFIKWYKTRRIIDHPSLWYFTYYWIFYIIYIYTYFIVHNIFSSS